MIWADHTSQHLPSSCAHLMAVPVSAALPSARYTTSEPIFQPTTGYKPTRGQRLTHNVPVSTHLDRIILMCVWVSLPATDVCGLLPVLMFMKVPVPMVILTSPTSKQHSPNMAACWSAIYSSGTEKDIHLLWKQVLLTGLVSSVQQWCLMVSKKGHSKSE